MRLRLHNHRDILQPLAEAGRNAFARGGDQAVKIGGLHGRLATCFHSSGLLLAQAERLHLRDVLIDDAQFPRALARELQLEVHDLVVALVLVIEFQFVAFGLGEKEGRFAVFHRVRLRSTRLHRSAWMLPAFNVPEIFLSGLDLQHQEDFPSMCRFPGARKFGRFGRRATLHRKSRQAATQAGVRIRRNLARPLPPLPLSPKRLLQRNLCRSRNCVSLRTLAGGRLW